MKIFSKKFVEKIGKFFPIRSYRVGVSIKRDWKYALVAFFCGLIFGTGVGIYVYVEITNGEAIFSSGAITAPVTSVFDKKKLNDVVLYYTKKDAEYQSHVQDKGKYVDPSF